MMKIKSITHHFLILLGLSLFILLSLNLTNSPNMFEGGLYLDKLESIAYDLDSNLINNTSDLFSKILSTTENVPDMHDWGAPLIWSIYYIPAFYLLPDYFLESIPILKTQSHYQSIHVIVYAINLLFLCLTFTFFFKTISIKEKKQKIILSLLFMIAFGHLGFAITDTLNADMISSFFTTLLIIFIINNNHIKNNKDYLSFGLIAGFCLYSKVSLLLNLPFLIGLIIFKTILSKETPLEKKISHISSLLFAFVIMFSLIAVNRYITNGFFNLLSGYDYAYSFEYLLKFKYYIQSYFGKSGLFIMTPFLLISLFHYFTTFFKLKKSDFLDTSSNLVFICAYSSVIIKYLLGLFCFYVAYQGYGARNFWIDGWVFFFSFIYLYNKNKYLKSLLIISCIISFINFLWWLRLNGSFELITLSTITFNDVLYQMKETAIRFYKVLINFDYLIKYTSQIFILILPLYLIYYFLKKLNRPFPNIRYYGYFCALVLLVFTMTNLQYNIENTDRYLSNKRNENYIIGNGSTLFIYHEYMSAIMLALEDAKAQKDKELFRYRINQLLEYLSQSQDELVWGNFIHNEKLMLQCGYFDKNVDLNEIINYNGELQFN